MPNSNGRIYVDGTGDITYGVSIADVRKVLGVSSTDLRDLCKSENINKWARYKPVAYAGFPIRFTGNTAFDKVTGLNINGMIGTPSDVAAYYGQEVTYVRPNGGMSSPYRLSDFNRYNHYAQKPIKIIWGSSFKTDVAMYSTVDIYDRTSSDEDSESISFSDIMAEIAGSGYFNSGTRLCLAVFEMEGGEMSQEPFYYFFSDKFTAVGTSGSWMVRVNMGNSEFRNSLVNNDTYGFKVMIVSNISALENLVPNTDRYVWEYGVNASTMAQYEGAGMKAMSLELELGEDVTTCKYGQSSVVTDTTYTVDAIEVYDHGQVVSNVLCVQVNLPNIDIVANTQIPNSAKYQMAVAYSQGSSSYLIYRPTDKVGDNYYGLSESSYSSMQEIKLTPWISIGSPTVQSGKYYYEISPANNHITVTSNDAPQTQGAQGIFFFFDRPSGGGTFKMSFTLYYRESDSANTVRVGGIDVTYNSSTGEGGEYDKQIITG